MSRIVVDRLLQQQSIFQRRCGLGVNVLTREFHIKTRNQNASSMSDLKSLLSKAKVGGETKSHNSRDDGSNNKTYKGKSREFKKADFSSDPAGRDGSQIPYGNKKYPPREKEFKNRGDYSDKRLKLKNSPGGGKGKKDFKKTYKTRSGHDAEGEKRQRKKFLFLETGNDRDKDAAKRIIAMAMKENERGLVQVIKGGGVVEVVNVVDAFQDMVLSEKGIVIVGNRSIKADDEEKHGMGVGSKLLILKVVERQLAIKQYGDYLSEQVVEKLKLSRSNILDKQRKKKDDGGSGGRGELKVVQIGWNINLNDLTGQKKFEIENHLKKGSDVEIVFDERSFLDKDNHSFHSGGGGSTDSGSADKMEVYSKRRKELNEVERALRNKMLAIVEANLRELEGLPESNMLPKKGFLESRLLLRVKGIDRQDGESGREDKREKKRQEKVLKAEKIRQRREEKERLARETLKEFTL